MSLNSSGLSVNWQRRRKRGDWPKFGANIESRILVQMVYGVVCTSFSRTTLFLALNSFNFLSDLFRLVFYQSFNTYIK